ncbi:DUF2850 domain-containing protein [Vibrio genomosp. F10]|uniref:DUF2850 domain-containing protein n=1 Tax=Vibrio genomosp. F10 TaxID=723171 RepID=UPI0003126EFA|nr:DUF2850 domain-containing protein [Vibrio genomosp. F10]OEF09098.1 hypothetical protein A1QI_14960 [Vibrio genomosp. F10 str. 9ZB36]
MAPQKITKTVKKKKELIVFSVLLLVSMVAVLAYSSLFKQVRLSLVDQQSIHGVWVEQHVADYATNNVHIGPDGVSVAGRIVATRYEFDGSTLEYLVGETLYQYRMLDELNTKMIQISDNHYNPTYYLVEKYSDRVR